MSVEGSRDPQLTTPRAEPRPPWQVVVLEVVASLAATGAGALIFLNHFGAHGPLAWHTLVAVAGVLVALTFPVTQAGLVREQPEPVRPERPDRPGSPVCHSGGDSQECVGG